MEDVISDCKWNNEWDSIGVVEEGVTDEYDVYTQKITSLIVNG